MGTRRIVFVDRDGTLVREPPDEQVDSLEKLALVDGVIPAMLALRDAGHAFVMVTNQDGLGSPAYPRGRWDLVQSRILELFGSQGIAFEDVLVCPHRAGDGCLCRKPHLGLVRPYLGRGELDLDGSAVVGDRETDLRLAENMGVRGFRLGAGTSWRDIARELVSRPRRARRRRKTTETSVDVAVELDRQAAVHVDTGIGFLDHMLEQLARHGGFGLEVEARGDLRVDEHHTVEDVALALGECLREALGDKHGTGRYGFVLPMDEALAQAALDLSGRPYFVRNGELPGERVGGLSTEMVDHFFRSFSTALGAALHLDVRGGNTHHVVEAMFKSVGRALRPAMARNGGGIPSTKGVL